MHIKKFILEFFFFGYPGTTNGRKAWSLSGHGAEHSTFAYRMTVGICSMGTSCVVYPQQEHCNTFQLKTSLQYYWL